ncbi:MULTISPECIES: HipA family kinase [unclassified Thalassospira]|uniref:HipA family kinase n=1 Tax=unclassified Thalassospira TaxID=2648997 RepID=UPI001B10C6FB|nr:HipA family kinase [Thalassospira sp.]MBO6772888.1 hypothetical protein [Thalassospira sp.]
MLDLLEAVRFDGRIRPEHGKTEPWLVCGQNVKGGDEVEVVMKVSGSCDSGVKALIVEALSAALAADLGLPVPEPFLVSLSPQFLASVTDSSARAIGAKSSQIAFGSKRIENCSVLLPFTKLNKQQLVEAANIFAFDGGIENPDRRNDKPNCLISNDKLTIIDHELAFSVACGLILFTRIVPWKLGGLSSFANGESAHLFFGNLKGNNHLDFSDYIQRWKSLNDGRLNAYLSAIPPAWQSHNQTAYDIVLAMKQIRDNIDGCINEVSRVLKGA